MEKMPFIFRVLIKNKNTCQVFPTGIWNMNQFKKIYLQDYQFSGNSLFLHVSFEAWNPLKFLKIKNNTHEHLLITLGLVLQK